MWKCPWLRSHYKPHWSILFPLVRSDLHDLTMHSHNNKWRLSDSNVDASVLGKAHMSMRAKRYHLRWWFDDGYTASCLSHHFKIPHLIHNWFDIWCLWSPERMIYIIFIHIKPISQPSYPVDEWDQVGQDGNVIRQKNFVSICSEAALQGMDWTPEHAGQTVSILWLNLSGAYTVAG